MNMRMQVCREDVTLYIAGRGRPLRLKELFSAFGCEKPNKKEKMKLLLEKLEYEGKIRFDIEKIDPMMEAFNRLFGQQEEKDIWYYRLISKA